MLVRFRSSSECPVYLLNNITSPGQQFYFYPEYSLSQALISLPGLPNGLPELPWGQPTYIIQCCAQTTLNNINTFILFPCCSGVGDIILWWECAWTYDEIHKKLFYLKKRVIINQKSRRWRHPLHTSCIFNWYVSGLVFLKPPCCSFYKPSSCVSWMTQQRSDFVKRFL